VYADSRKFLIALGLFALACGVALGTTLTRSITRPLARAVALAQQVASGDLTADIRVSSKDEVGGCCRR
jgi:methyl-accepting chemotaxis protein